MPRKLMTEDRGLALPMFMPPALPPAVLRGTPCLRISNFLLAETAQALFDELRDGIEYERVELGDITRQWRAARPLGDVYFGAMKRKAGWTTSAAAAAALEWLESPGFVSWLSAAAGEELVFLRPPTAYRMDRGDRLCLHDDMSDPDHAISVAYNLSPGWRPELGGATMFGEVTAVTPLPTPADSPIDLRQWHIRDTRRFVPEFNSMLVMRLDVKYAHGVEEVLGGKPRFAIVGIYGRAWSS